MALLHLYKCKHRDLIYQPEILFYIRFSTEHRWPIFHLLSSYERYTFYSDGALTSHSADSEAIVTIQKSNFAITVRYILPVLCWSSIQEKKKNVVFRSHSIIALIPTKSSRGRKKKHCLVCGAIELSSRQDGFWPAAVRKYLQTKSNLAVSGLIFPEWSFSESEIFN